MRFTKNDDDANIMQADSHRGLLQVPESWSLRLEQAELRFCREPDLLKHFISTHKIASPSWLRLSSRHSCTYQVCEMSSSRLLPPSRVRSIRLWCPMILLGHVRPHNVPPSIQARCIRFHARHHMFCLTPRLYNERTLCKSQNASRQATRYLFNCVDDDPSAPILLFDRLVLSINFRRTYALIKSSFRHISCSACVGHPRGGAQTAAEVSYISLRPALRPDVTSIVFQSSPTPANEKYRKR